jgi:hypothetical protein
MPRSLLRGQPPEGPRETSSVARGESDYTVPRYFGYHSTTRAAHASVPPRNYHAHYMHHAPGEGLYTR